MSRIAHHSQSNTLNTRVDRKHVGFDSIQRDQCHTVPDFSPVVCQGRGGAFRSTTVQCMDKQGNPVRQRVIPFF
jgi:hypothetical protein